MVRMPIRSCPVIGGLSSTPASAPLDGPAMVIIMPIGATFGARIEGIDHS